MAEPTGTPELDPVIQPAASAPVNLPWTPEDTAKWNARLEAAKRVTQDLVQKGKQRVKNYRQRPFNMQVERDTVRVPAEFWYVEQKRAQMFYRVPEITLTGQTPEAEGGAPLFAAVINKYLGPEKTNVKIPMDEILFDILCPVGFGAVKIGYYSTQSQAPHPLDPTMQTMVPVSESYEVTRISPGRLLVPPDFHGSDFDDADWIGFEVYEAVPEGTPGAQTDRSNKRDDDLLSVTPETQSYTSTRRRSREVWYRACRFDPTITDTEQIRMFVWRDGEPEPSKHVESPNERVMANGSLLRMHGFPISVCTIRYVSDTAFPPSDCEIIENLVDELSKGRTQLLQTRDRNMPQTGYDATTVTKDTLDKIGQGVNLGMIGFNGPGQNSIWPINKGNAQPENYSFNTVTMNDMDRAMAMGSAQTGVAENLPGETTTATEQQITQQNSDTRLDYERDKFVQWFLQKVVAKLARLIQMNADSQDYVRILGPQNAARFETWTKEQIQGDFNFSIKINSQLRPDSASDLRRITAWVNYSAQSQYINQAENWRMAAEGFGMDPGRLMKDPEPPPKEEPKISIAIKGEDLDPFKPQYQNIVLLLTRAGMDGMSPAQQPQNVLTPGTAEKAPVLDKHSADETGQLPGGGSMVATETGSEPRGTVQ